MATTYFTPEFKTKFYSKVRITADPDKCWEWTGCKASKNYGTIGYQGKYWYTHRLAYEMHYGVEPGEMFVCHACDNPSCVNPAHLWLGTAKENTLDMYRKGRGKQAPFISYETAEDIRAWVRITNRTSKSLSELYSVSLPNIRKILLNQILTSPP